MFISVPYNTYSYTNPIVTLSNPLNYQRIVFGVLWLTIAFTPVTPILG